MNDLNPADANRMAPGETLAAMARHAMTAEPDRKAIEFEHRWITYGEMGILAERVAELIRLTGADRRAPVAFAPRNTPPAIAALMGLIAEMRNIRMMYAYQSGEALAGNFKRIDASILVAAGEDFSTEVVDQLREEGCAGIALKGDGADFVPGLERVTKPTDPKATEKPTFEMLTSGTTGDAKLWPLTYELLEQRYIHGNSVFGKADLAGAPPSLLCYPLCNISGLYTAVPTMLTGMQIVLETKFSLEAWLDYVKRYRPKALYLPPVGLQMILDADIPPEDLSSGEFCYSGMTSIPVEVQKAFQDKYGIPILLNYGATEFGGVVVMMTLEDAKKWGDEKLGSTGRAYGEARVRVTDPDSGEPLPPDETGLLEVLVPSIKEGWNRTSDLARIDQDGFVYILGRADGAIMRGGFKILPEVVERALLQHPDLEAVAVVGMDDQRLGQVPAALVQLKEGAAAPTKSALEEYVRRHLPATHIPVIWGVIDTMPRTPSLKISRAEVKQILSQESNRLA